MMWRALAATGWSAAGVAVVLVRRLRRDGGQEREAVVRAAHELRGALTTIGLAAQAAARPTTAEGERRDGIGPGRVVGPGRAIDPGRAIAVALDRAGAALADLDGGTAPTRPVVECFEARQLLSDCAAATRPLADARGVSLVERWEGPSALVVGERARLAQALTNLITNAVEHGGGAVTVDGRSVRGSVQIEVCDDGQGLPASLAMLTRRARQGVGRRGRGLAIAQDVATRHRGAVVASPPTPTGGARLALVLPKA